MYQPKISIVIPAYNASNYLSEAIDSALAQTYPNVEIIVVNDGSKDNGATERIALSYGDKIRYFSKENGGASSALNMGIANMTGEWFSWLSHDDIYLPHKLECQMEYISSLQVEEQLLSEHIFFAPSNKIDASGKLIKKYSIKQARRMSEKVYHMAHNGYLIAEPTVHIFHGCSCLIHRKALSQVGCFDEGLRLLNDVDMWYRLYTAGCRVHFIPEVLVLARIHGKQVSRSIGYSYHNSEQDMYWNRCLDWLLDNYPEEEKLFFRYARNAYLKTRNAEGDRAFSYIKTATIKKKMLKTVYICRAGIRNFIKWLYLMLKT